MKLAISDLVVPTYLCMEPLSLLLVLITIHDVTATNGSLSCPLWHYREQGECKCGYDVQGAVVCAEDMIYLRVDSTMDVWQNVIYVAQSRYAYHNLSAIPRHYRIYFPIPIHTQERDLNELMCKENMHRGFLCSKCLPTYGPSTYHAKCAKCDLSLASAVALYIIMEFLPVIILFLLIVTFHIDFTRGPILGYIFFCQSHMTVASEVSPFYQIFVLQLRSVTVIGRISFFISAIWNLQINSLIPPFCISPYLRDFDILFFNFLALLFPFSLVIVTYVLIELHARDFKLVVYCWKPFHTCFVRIRQNWNVSDSIIHAFASLMFLSFISLNYSAYQLFVSSNIYMANSTHALRTNVFSHPEVYGYKPRYFTYCVVTMTILLFLGILPTLFLLLYPIRIFRERLQRYFSHRLIIVLNTFVETFQGTFKDGCHGTRDFRIIPGALGVFILFLSLVFCLVHGTSTLSNYVVPIAVVSLAFLSVMSAYLQPCKSYITNLSLSFHFMVMAICGFLLFLWEYDLSVDTTVPLVALVSIPHILMFLWVCYIILKKINLRKRSMTCLCFMMEHITPG